MATLGSGGLGMGIVFALEDQFTKVSQKIRTEQGKLLESSTSLGDGATKALNKISQAKILAGGLAILAPLGAMVKFSAELSDGLANVQKTTGLTNVELQNLRDTIEGFDTRTSISSLLEIGTVGGRLGVAKEELEGFIKTVDKAVVALGDEFSGGAEQIAGELGRIKTLFGETKGLKFDIALNQIGSALNELGNAGANSSPQVAEFTKRIGALGSLAPTLAQTLGLGATLEELGLTAEISSGGLTNLLTTAGQNSVAFATQMGISTEAFQDLLDTDPNQMIIQLSKSFQGLDNSSAIKALFNMKVGSQESLKVILGLSNNLDVLEERQTLAAKAMLEATSLTNEFNVKNTTLAANIEKLTKRFTILAQRIGDAVAPVFMFVAGLVGILVETFLILSKSPIGKFLLQLTTGLALGAVAWAAYNLAIRPAIFSLRAMAIQAIATLTAMSPLYLMVIPFIALIAVMAKGVQAFDNFNGVVDTGFGKFLQQVGGVIRGIMAIATSWDNVSETFLLSKGMAQNLDKLGILDFVVTLGTWIVRLIEFVKGLWAGIKAGFSLMATIGKAFLKLFKPINYLFQWLINLLGKNTSEVKLWAEAGKLAGIAIAIILGLLIAKFIFLGIVAIISMLPVIAVMALIALAIYGVYHITQWLITKFQELWGESTGWLDFGKNMVINIWDGVKAMWGQFTGWLSNAMKNIPVVGRFFQDEEASATITQQVNTQGSISNAITQQQGLLSRPSQQNAAGSGVMQLPQTQNINLIVEGQKMASVVNDKNKIEQARE